MDHDFARLGVADCDVKRHPRYSKPARPIVTSQHEHSRDAGEEFSYFDPHVIGMKRPHSWKMGNEATGADRNVQARED